jgi:hypothetical protein
MASARSGGSHFSGEFAFQEGSTRLPGLNSRDTDLRRTLSRNYGSCVSR